MYPVCLKYSYLHKMKSQIRKKLQIFILAYFPLFLYLVGCSISPITDKTPIAIATTEPILITPTTYVPTPSVAVSKIITRTPTPTPISKISSPTSTIQPTIIDKITPTITSSIDLNIKYSSDLLFLSENNLYIWNHTNNSVQILNENIFEYDADVKGKNLVLLKSQNMVANGVELFDLIVQDLETSEQLIIIDDSPRLYNLSISPNNEWVTYNPNQNGGKIIARNTNSDQIIELGFCHQPLNSTCQSIVWSTDSREMLWGDQRGMWHMKLDWESPHLVTNNTIEVIDPDGNVSEISVTFDNFSWSPLGRYALCTIVPSTSATKWYAVIDTRRNRITEIRDSLLTGIQTTNVSWLLDGSFVVGYDAQINGNHILFLDLYRVVPTQGNLLQLINSYPLQKQIMPTPVTNSDQEWSYMIDWPEQLTGGQLNFGMLVSDANTPPILFKYIFDKNYLELINHIPSYTQMVYWAPDSSGALIVGVNNEIFFSHNEQGTLTDLHQVLGASATDFAWLPPKLKQ